MQAKYSQSASDYSLFVWKRPQGLTILLLYVDDILLIGDDIEGIQNLKFLLRSCFHMKDLGPLSHFLGLEVQWNSWGYFVFQQKYTSDLVKLANLIDDKRVDTPLELNVKLSKSEGSLLHDASLYRKLVGFPIYLTMTRPDISHAVQVGLFFSSSSSIQLRVYADVDWAGCPDICRSNTGYCVFMGDSLISWKCNKQQTASKSSAEAEYRAMPSICSEVVLLISLF
ncbi:PREDICTED: uncharacterized protein LOC109115653 [Nelumbo nucifera]|uniref:Uncharacterized protein LOC109115653 n=1 Tax=Nelumbo nucifera TaxID=4432 RepID=A0A1U8QBF7_NELNU|nr:PREDICTED: uncharacterized protein LOC109115653 [Nelumbo nucifera]